MHQIVRKISLFSLCIFIFTGIFGNSPEFEVLKKEIKTLLTDSLKQAIEMAEYYHQSSLESKDKYKIAESYYLLGYAFSDIDYEKSIDYLNKSLEYSNATENTPLINDSYFLLGLLHYMTFQNHKALEYYYDCLDYYLKTDKQQDIADTYQNLGLVFDELMDTTKALQFYGKSLAINKMLENDLRCASINHNIGVILSHQNNLEKALEYYNSSLKYFKKSGFKEGVASVENNIGVIYEKKGDYKNALISYNNALEMFNKIEQTRSIVIGNYNVAKAHMGLQHYSKAQQYLQKCIYLADSFNIPDYKANASYDLAEIFEKTGDFKSALLYYKNYNDLDDSLFNVESEAKLAEIESKFSNELTKQELVRKTKNLNRKTLFLYILTMGAFLFLFVSILLYIEKRKNIKVQAELIKHKDHLETLVKEKSEALENEIYERKVAEESDKLKSAFLANMSHEIRTPMNSIISFSNYLKDNTLEQDKRNEYVHYIISCGQNLLQLINDILDIAKIEADQIRISLESVNLTTLLKEIYDIFHENKSHQLTNIEFQLNKHYLQENVVMTTDYNRLVQVLSNLLENAFKYTSCGSIEFGIEKIKNNIVFFYVKDTGIGIPLNKSKRIFERFQQAETALDKKSRGAGLGLAICQNIIEILGGKIWVNSTLGEGTTFRFTLPYRTLDINQTKHKRTNPLKKSKVYNWNDKTILIAEDEDLNFKVLEIGLKSTNAILIRAKNGIDALELIKNNNVDIVLMDIQMPLMDGYKATAEMKKLYPETPVIAQTSFAMSDDRQRCFESGCSDFVTKPLNMNELFQKINRLLNVKIKNPD